MGVNCKLVFPYGTRIRDVSKVAGRLLGNKSYHTPLNGSEAVFARVDGISFRPWINEVSCADIVIDVTNTNPAAQLIRNSDGDKYHLGYHFEGEGGPLIMPKCYAPKIALCAGLVKFFGGKLDFNDCDSVEWNLRVKANPYLNASNDPEWSILNQGIIDVLPITEEDIDKYQKYSSY